MNIVIPIGWALAFLFCPAVQDKPAPIPAAGEVRKAQAEIKALFKADFAASGREPQRALARRFLQEAENAGNSPASRYALLEYARDFAVSSLDLPTAFAAIDRLDGLFELTKPPLTGAVFTLNGNANKAYALVQAQKSAVGEEDSLVLGEGYFVLTDRALADRNYDDALGFSKLADRYSKSLKSSAIQDLVTRRLVEIPELKKEDEQQAKLNGAASDAASKLLLGRFLLFAQGKDAEGLALLAEASDANVKTAAAAEIAKGGTPAAQAEVAEAWLAASAKETNPLHKSRYVRRSVRWFEEATRGATGLEKAKIEKRYEDLGLQGKLLTPWVDLLPAVNAKVHGYLGTWEKSGTRLVNTDGKWSKLELPYEPAGEYDFRVRFETGSPTEPVILGVFRGRPFEVGLHLDSGVVSIYTGGPNQDTGGVAMPIDRPLQVVLEVRLNDVSIIVQGKKVKTWIPNVEALTPNNFWAPRSVKQLGLGHHGPKLTYLSVHVVEITGRGKPMK